MSEPEMTAESPTPLTADRDAAWWKWWDASSGRMVSPKIAFFAGWSTRETALRETIAQAWDEGYRASGGDHWWTFEPGDECEQPHRPNPYRRQA